MHFLWMTRGEKFFFVHDARKTRERALCAWFREALRLIARAQYIQFVRSHPLSKSKPVADAVHRFQESIAGRPYLIEVVAVSQDRWRAYIVRIPGVPTALMPFYGATPADAARRLFDWLTRAHARASTPAGTV